MGVSSPIPPEKVPSFSMSYKSARTFLKNDLTVKRRD
jgi:hypothetical protein